MFPPALFMTSIQWADDLVRVINLVAVCAFGLFMIGMRSRLIFLTGMFVLGAG